MNISYLKGISGPKYSSILQRALEAEKPCPIQNKRMNTYHVTYFYLATGMEGTADTKDHGLVEANSAQEAINIVGFRTSPPGLSESHRNWGLSARLVYQDTNPPSKLDTMKRLARGEPINELTEIEKPMNYTSAAITSINAAVEAIRQKKFIVGSVDAQGCISFSQNPVTHASRASARAECSRLAKLSTGKLFIFVELAGGEMLPTLTTVSI